MQTRILVIIIVMVTTMFGAFFITFSCSEAEDPIASTNGDGGDGGGDGGDGGDGGGGDNNICGETGTEINTAEELQAIKDILDGNFCLVQDIDLSSITDFEPIGTDTALFTGTLDGNNKKIINLSISRGTEDYIGLFAQTDTTAIIKDLTVENANILGNSKTGALIGLNQGTITNVHITGTSTVEGSADKTGGFVGNNKNGTITYSSSNATVTGTTYTGGFAGYNLTATITNSYTTGNIIGTSYVGGFVGSSFNISTISDSYATGTVNGISYIGGFGGRVGESIDDPNTPTTVENSYATGDVTGRDRSMGGFAGIVNYASLLNNYATGNVTGENGSFQIGGFAGYIVTSTITNSYAEGNVSGSNKIGGFSGIINGTPSTVSNCYATGNVTGSSSIGGFTGDAYHKNIAENCYATGSVTGNSYVGGFAGRAKNTLKNSYATGLVTANVSDVGGMIGFIMDTQRFVAENNYFDNVSTGQTNGVGNAINTNITGITTTDIISNGEEPFTTAGWQFAGSPWESKGDGVWPTFIP